MTIEPLKELERLRKENEDLKARLNEYEREAKREANVGYQMRLENPVKVK